MKISKQINCFLGDVLAMSYFLFVYQVLRLVYMFWLDKPKQGLDKPKRIFVVRSKEIRHK